MFEDTIIFPPRISIIQPLHFQTFPSYPHDSWYVRYVHIFRRLFPWYSVGNDGNGDRMGIPFHDTTIASTHCHVPWPRRLAPRKAAAAAATARVTGPQNSSGPGRVAGLS